MMNCSLTGIDGAQIAGKHIKNGREDRDKLKVKSGDMTFLVILT